MPCHKQTLDRRSQLPWSHAPLKHPLDLWLHMVHSTQEEFASALPTQMQTYGRRSLGVEIIVDAYTPQSS